MGGRTSHEEVGTANRQDERPPRLGDGNVAGTNVQSPRLTNGGGVRTYGAKFEATTGADVRTVSKMGRQAGGTSVRPLRRASKATVRLISAIVTKIHRKQIGRGGWDVKTFQQLRERLNYC